MISHWSLSGSKFPQVFRTLLSILTYPKNALVCMVYIRAIISQSSSPCTNPLVDAPRAPLTIGTTVTFIFHSSFQFPSNVQILIRLFTFFHFYSVASRDSKVKSSKDSVCFIFCWILQGLIIWPTFGDPFVSLTPLDLYVSFYRTDSVLYIYHLFVWSNFIFLHHYH